MGNYLVVIAGPTAVGKTLASIEIARFFNTEIISCDSRQVYKEATIGTAVPSSEELNMVKHYFVRNKSIHNYYNASMFELEVLELLDKLFLTRNVVIMTGGSGLYINAVCYGIDDLPDVDMELRTELAEKYKNQGIDSIRQQLKILDPAYYSVVDLKNPKRILKALEVSLMTGKPYSSFLTRKSKKRQFNTILIGLNMERELLYKRINKRVENMMEQGLLEEVKSLYQFRHLNALNTVGYKELFDFLDNKISLDEAVDLIKRNTRKYARKQITWFRKYKDLRWFEPRQTKQIIQYINDSINS